MGILLKSFAISAVLCFIISLLFKGFSWSFFVPIALTATLIKLHLRKGVYLAYAKQLYLQRQGILDSTESKFLLKAASIFVEIYRPTPQHIKLEPGAAVGYIQIIGMLYTIIMIFKGLWVESGWSLLAVAYMYFGSNLAYSFVTGNYSQDRLRVEKLVKEPIHQRGHDIFENLVNKLTRPPLN